MSYPIIIYPEGVQRPMVAFGSSGIIFRDSCNDTEVLKCPLRHDLSKCSEETALSMREEEAFSSMSIEREMLIYQSLPKHSHVLDCIDITEKGIRLPYMRHGNLRDYIRKNHAHVDNATKDTWIQNAVRALQFIHSHSVIHGDISARNFLVADDLSLKLCDFAGSGIGDMPPLVTEEDRYRLSPESPRSIQTDLFALGCLIFEIVAGYRPYEEIGDDDWETIAQNYSRGIFPPVEGIRYGDIIHQCWTSRYTKADQVLADIENVSYGRPKQRVNWLDAVFKLPRTAILSLGMLPVGIFLLYVYRKHR